MLRERVRNLLAERRNGFSLPRDFYVDEQIFKADLEAVFETDWLFACNVCEIKRPGDYLTFEIGTQSIVVLRDRDGADSSLPQHLPAPRLTHLQRREGPREPAGLPLSSVGL